MGFITGFAHVNLTIPEGTLHLAHEFYGNTLGLTSVPVPKLQLGTLAWFDLTPGGQQVHVSFERGSEKGGVVEKANGQVHPHSSRHPCFKIGTAEDLEKLKTKIWEHFKVEGESESRPLEADQPGQVASGAKGVEYPTRFFARDFAGNRLEFSL